MCKECLKKQQHQQKTQKAANLNCCQNDLLKTTCFACAWLYLSHITTLPVQPPWSRLLALGVCKPSCSTPFTLFLCLVSVYWPFHLYFIPKALSTVPPFSAPFLQLNSFIPVSYLALLPLIPMFLYAQQSFHSWVFVRKKCMKEGMWVWVICVCKLLVKPWQPIYHCVGKWIQKAMVTLSESLSPGGWHTGADKGDTYLF